MKRQEAVRNDMRSLRIATSRLRRNNDELMRNEEDLRKELEAVKAANKQLKQRYDAEVITAERTLRRETKNLTSKNRELRTTLRALRKNETTKKWENEVERVKALHEVEKGVLMKKIEDLEEELQSVKVANCKLQNRLQSQFHGNEAVKKTLLVQNQDLQQELAALKVASHNVQNQLEMRLKAHEEEKKVLINLNQTLRQELETMKTMVPSNNLQLDSIRPGAKGVTDGSGEPKVSIHTFHPIRVLGEGGFGKVILAKKPDVDGTHQLFAIKVLNKACIIDECNVSSTITEKQCLILASEHPFVTTLYSCFQTKEHLFFVLEYASGGSLLDQLQHAQVFTEETSKFYSAEITLALEYLHNNGILHRDLKLDNVLVGADGHCRVADFGLSKLGLFYGRNTKSICGTRCYMAPEMLHRLPYGQGVDWWALGIMLYAMLTGQLPFDDTNTTAVEYYIKNCAVSYPEGISREAELIMKGLLMKDPSQRLGTGSQAQSVRQQRFFRGIDWRALMERRVTPPYQPHIVNTTYQQLWNLFVIEASKVPGVSCSFALRGMG